MNVLSPPVIAEHPSAPHVMGKKAQNLPPQIMPPQIMPPQIMPDKHIDPFHLFGGAQTSPIVLSVPHGGWQYPESLVKSDNFDQCTSLADTGTAELGTMLAGGLFPVLIASCGRAVCDLNRPQQALDSRLCAEADCPVPAAFTPHVAAGYGVIPRLSAKKQPLYETMLDRTQWQMMLAAWHTPYHQTLSELLRLASTDYEGVFLIDLHSMPDMPDMPNRPHAKRFFHAASKGLPDFVFGNLHGATLTKTSIGRIDTVMGRNSFSWQWNTPYAGGYITRHYGLGTDASDPVQVLQIEVNRRLYRSHKNSISEGRMRPVKQILDQIVTVLAGDA